jgi:hypothetical protein
LRGEKDNCTDIMGASKKKPGKLRETGRKYMLIDNFYYVPKKTYIYKRGDNLSFIFSAAQDPCLGKGGKRKRATFYSQEDFSIPCTQF